MKFFFIRFNFKTTMTKFPKQEKMRIIKKKVSFEFSFNNKHTHTKEKHLHSIYIISKYKKK